MPVQSSASAKHDYVSNMLAYYDKGAGHPPLLLGTEHQKRPLPLPGLQLHQEQTQHVPAGLTGQCCNPLPPLLIQIRLQLQCALHPKTCAVINFSL